MPIAASLVQKAYVAYFNRPADTAGLNYWSTSFTGTLETLLNTFAGSAEYTNQYTGMNNTAIVNQIYQNLFARDAEPAGLAHWVGKLDRKELSLGTIASSVADGAQNTDLTSVTNKVTAAAAFTNSLDTGSKISSYASSSTASMASVKAWMAGVTTDASLTSSTTATALTTVTSGVSAASTGSTFTLTTGVDNTTATNITGLIDQNTAANSTWNLSDSVSSSAGTFNLSVITAGAALAGFNTSGVTTLKIKAIDASANAIASSFDVGSMTGLKAVSIANASVIGATADTYTINSAASGTTVALDTNGSTQNVTVNYASAATSGAADTATVSVTGRSGTFLLGTGFETLALTGGTAGRVAAANSETTASIKTVTVAGVDMRVDAALDSTVTSIDASKATGTVNLAAAPGATFAAIGGAGTSDILAVSTLTSTHTVTGFETLVATAAATYDLTGATATNLGVGVGAGAVSFTNAAVTTNTIVLGGLQQRTTGVAATGSLTTGGTIGYALKTATGASDTLNIAVNNGGTTTTGTMTVGGATTATAIENIAITVADWKAVTFGGLTLSTTTTAASNVTVAATAANMTFGTIGLTQGTTTLGAANVINFGAVTGTTSATVGTVATVTFTGGTGVDTTTVGVTDITATGTYNMGAGNDVVTVAANTANAATSITNINGEAGDDTIFLGGTNVTTLTLNINGGDGTDTVRITTGSSFIDSLTNVEKLVSLDTGTTTIAASSTAVNNSLEITQVAAGVTAFTTTAGQIVSIAGVTGIGTLGATTLTLTGSTGAETLTGSATFGTTITGAAGADVMTGGTGADVYIIAQTESNSTDGIDTISNYTASADTLDLATNTIGTVNTADTDANVFNNTAAVASTGITVTTLLANLQTAGDSLANNAFDQIGDTFSVTISGASLRGTDVIYVVQNDGANTTVTAADTIIALIGTSTGALTVALTA